MLAQAKLSIQVVLEPLMHKDSDALFNLGYALSAAQLLPPGVWIAMNGEVFEWNNVEKNRAKRRFEQTQ